MDDLRPKVGVGVMVMKNGKILLGRRIDSDGSNGEYQFAGGHLEHLEKVVDCAKREVMEEAGIEIENVRFHCLNNTAKYLPKHYINVGVIADWKSGEPEVREPHKCAGWGWYDLDSLPTPLFESIPNFIQAYKTGENFFDMEIHEYPA